MRKFLVLPLLMFLCSAAMGEVSLRICTADGNTPFDTNTPIMVGTRLTFICSSDSNETFAWLSIAINGADQDFGVILARGPYIESPEDWSGSHLPAAGINAQVADWPPNNAFDMYTDSPIKGDWFIFDYAATNPGTCTVTFYINMIGDDWPSSETTITFTHVPTRDFIDDGRIDFADFAIFASYWGQTDCDAANNDCDGKDLHIDGRIDFLDMAYFVDYWLEQLY